MDPAAAVGLWLLGNAVAPDAYTRLVDVATSKSHEKRLRAAVRRDTGIRPGLPYRRWLRDEHTWADLVERRQDAYDRLVERLAATEARGILRRRPEDPERARRLVDATIAFFLPTLDPSMATAVVDFRAERRHEELVERLDASRDYEERLQLLPPVVAPLLRDEVVHRGMAERLVDGILREDPRSVIAAWCNQRPKWLADAPSVILLALGELAQAYGLRAEAAQLFEEAADLGADPPRWYARAAFEAQAGGEPNHRDALLSKAHAAGGGEFVEFLDAALHDDWAAALSSLSAESAASDVFVGPIYAFVLGQDGQADAELSLLSRFVDANPEFSGAALRLAQLLLARALRPGTTSRDLDIRKALDLAIGARDRRRVWRGDSGEAVEIACHAMLIAGDFGRAISLGTIEPEGEASPAEAARPDVQFLVAQAALAAGSTSLVQQLAEAAQGFHQALLGAELAANSDASPDELARAYDSAWALAQSEEDKVGLWLSAAMNGLRPIPGEAELSARDDDLPLMCLGTQHVAAGEFDQAIDLIRPHRSSEPLRRLLTDAYIRKGDVDAAVSELRDMSQRFGNVDHLIRAVEALVAAGRLSEARDLADATLTLVPPGRRERGLLHEVGVAHAHNAHRWADMETRVRAWIAESSADRRKRWLLVMAVYNQADPERAWRILQEAGDECPPESVIEAQLWIALHGRFRPGAETLAGALALTDRFPDDADVRTVAVNTFFLMGDDKGEIDDETLARWHALIEERAASPAPDDTFVSISIPDDPDGLVEAFRPLLEGRAQLIDTWVRRIRREVWPYGMLAMVAGQAYAKTLAQRPTGFLPIATLDSAVHDSELEAAREAVSSGHIVVDLSAVVVASYIPERWPQLLAAFTRVEVTPSSRKDAAIAADTFQPRSNETLGWDLESGRPVLQTIEDETLDRLESQLKWVHEQVATLPVLEGEAFKPEADERFGSWMDAFRAARAAGVALWADDIGLRTLARNEGVAAFGTDSLLRALESSGRLTEADLEAALESLREQYCVDLPQEPAWIRRSAEQDGWRPGPALLAMSRTVMWAEPVKAFELWSQIAASAATSDFMKVPAWVYAGVTGILASPVDALAAMRLASGVLVKAASLVEFDPSAFADCAGAARAAARDAGLPDPTEFALAMTMDLFASRHGVATAATLVARLGSELADDQRASLRRILFKVGDGGGSEGGSE